MKRTTLVLALALVLTLVFSASAFATTGKFYKGGVDYYRWLGPTTSPSPGTAWIVGTNGISQVGSNTVEPGVHANYLATTAKCGICHSVHRADADGTKLLPTANATCAGCHVGSSAITAKIITVADVNLDWQIGDPNAEAGGGGGPHNDPVWDTVVEELPAGEPLPMPSYDLEPFSRYGCFTRRCHATNPHGANSSKYTLFAAKLLFNNSPAVDAAEAGTTTVGSYGGLDAQYDALGATDAAVQRFADANPNFVQLNGSDILIKKTGEAAFRAPNTAETHALVAGLTCGRPCVGEDGIGDDECHAEASYAIVDRGIKEQRNHATLISGNDGSRSEFPTAGAGGSNNYFRTDNTGGEAPGWGGNDNRDWKTGHIAGSFGMGTTAYAAIAGCTSCHDQTDSNNTVAGNFTFPHGQTPTGNTNAVAVNGATGTNVRSRIWSGWSSNLGAQRTVTDSTSKAYDGQCLKCHRDGANAAGVGKTF